MNARGREQVAANEPTVLSKPSLDAIVVEDSKSDRSFPDAPWTDESDWSETFCEADDLFDQLVASKASPWRRWRRLSKTAGCKM